MQMHNVPKPTYLLEEGTLIQAGELASSWFRCYFQIWEHTGKLV